MTEAEWLASTDPAAMLEFLRGKSSDRKLRLFGYACCRHAAHLFADEQCRATLSVAEQYVEGLAGEEEFLAATETGEQLAGHRPSQPLLMAVGPPWRIARALALGEPGAITRLTQWIVELVRAEANDTGAARRAPPGGEVQAARTAWSVAESVKTQEQTHQCELLRDIFVSPFRPVTVEACWQTSMVLALAQAIYDERGFDSLPILGDALEDAGCANRAILDHLRGPGVHVRGCWPVDLLLGRE